MQTLPNTTIDVFITSLANALQNIMAKDSTYTNTNLTRFHAPRVPSISVRQYVERVVSYAPCTVESFVVALVYLNRIAENQGAVFVNPRTIHRLFITSVLVAAKYSDDIYFNNKYYARVGGISGSEMNALELEFLFRLKFDCNSTAEEFSEFSHVLYEPEACVPEVDIDSLATYSVSPHTHSFMFPACGNLGNNQPGRTPYRRPMMTY
jgi:hypothetical protein